MSDYVQKPGTGNLFKNSFKQKDAHPDYKGSINVAGTEYDLAAWLKEGKNGKYMSLSVKAKDARKPAVEKQMEDFDDSLPF